MSDFDWHIAEEENKEDLFTEEPNRPNGRKAWFWLLSLTLVVLIVGGWGLARRQLNQQHDALQQQVQLALDFERTAYEKGDGDLFFSVQAADPRWFSDQLQPANQRLYQTPLTVSNAQTVESLIWANVTWQADGETAQRIMFFQEENGRLLHVPTDTNYWGRAFRLNAEWGSLSYPEIDSAWADAVTDFVTKTIDDICALDCPAERLPLTLVLTTDFSRTAVPNRLHIPSPRLLALDAEGQPAELFWQSLRRRLETHLAPTTTIRFAVPTDLYQLTDYDDAAADFMAANPDITVEIVTLGSGTTNPEAIPAADFMTYDGAAFPLDETLLASGHIVDLTDFVRSDPDFDQADYYEQIWQGAWWQERMWFLPQAGEIKVLYFDKEAYRLAEYPEPSLRWTWDEMAQDMIIIANPYSQNRPNWGFLDTGNDALFSYAYNWENDCTEAATVKCNHPLELTAVIAALDWYQQMAGEPGKMPNLSEIPPESRENLLMNWQSARRQAAIWVDAPEDFEFRLLLAPIGVLPFPGSNRFDGITPLRAHGHFITHQAENPLAVWKWLKFLSHQPPKPKFRYVPARPSVAEVTNYWRILPRELSNPMRIAFPFARPITFEEARYFTPEQIEAVLSGQATPSQAASISPPLTWFAPPENSN